MPCLRAWGFKPPPRGTFFRYHATRGSWPSARSPGSRSPPPSSSISGLPTRHCGDQFCLAGEAGRRTQSGASREQHNAPPPGQEPSGQSPQGQAPYGQGQFGQQPAGQPPYPGQQQYGAPAPQPKKSRTGLVIGIVAIVLVLVGGGIAFALLGVNDDTSKNSAGTGEATLSGESAGEGSPTTSPRTGTRPPTRPRARMRPAPSTPSPSGAGEKARPAARPT